MKDRLAAIELEQQATGPLAAFLTKIGKIACKDIINCIAKDPYNFGLDYDITASDVKRLVTAHADTIELYENGLCVNFIYDLDNVGGDSSNIEATFVGFDGKIIERFVSDGVTNGGDILAIFDAQDGWYRFE